MPIWQAVVLGVVQGLAEFLPISSSAHLILVPWLFGWEDPGLAFDVALHWGTLLAVLLVFWKDWIRLISAGLRSIAERRIGPDPDRRVFWALVVASIPGAILGKLLNERAEAHLRSPLLIAFTLAALGAFLWVGDRVGSKLRDMAQMKLGESAAIGVAQAAALVPGVSRSGATITLGLLLGYTREEIARFSFLMSTPIIFGAGVVKIPKLLRAMQAAGGPTNEGGAHVTAAALLAAVVASAIVGVVVIRWILQFLRTRGYGVFAVYRWLIAALIVVVWFSRQG
ncbi:MAG TPA: undecaprenyl-diphosphate phosphatase [Myxococcales bacterium]|jgi:undecaprenyl-diphosphatase|nr:undecaprenyl-diphosphate phosphatase [Myxococcales bacterium]